MGRSTQKGTKRKAPTSRVLAAAAAAASPPPPSPAAAAAALVALQRGGHGVRVLEKVPTEGITPTTYAAGPPPAAGWVAADLLAASSSMSPDPDVWPLSSGKQALLRLKRIVASFP